MYNPTIYKKKKKKKGGSPLLKSGTACVTQALVTLRGEGKQSAPASPAKKFIGRQAIHTEAPKGTHGQPCLVVEIAWKERKKNG